MTDGYCTACGRPAGDCDGGCRRPLDPPRFCAHCGRRLVVQVMPNHHVARCKHHGVVSAGG